MVAITTTQRGFAKGVFSDANGVECSIQESSAMHSEGLLWLGCSKAEPKELVPGRGWRDMPWDETTMLANTRMHLSQTQVRELLPTLQYFAEHGELPLDAG